MNGSLSSRLDKRKGILGKGNSLSKGAGAILKMQGVKMQGSLRRNKKRLSARKGRPGDEIENDFAAGL
jgi:hypothetical protein